MYPFPTVLGSLPPVCPLTLSEEEEPAQKLLAAMASFMGYNLRSPPKLTNDGTNRGEGQLLHVFGGWHLEGCPIFELQIYFFIALISIVILCERD